MSGFCGYYLIQISDLGYRPTAANNCTEERTATQEQQCECKVSQYFCLCSPQHEWQGLLCLVWEGWFFIPIIKNLLAYNLLCMEDFLCCMCFKLCMMQRLPIKSLTEQKVVKKFQKAGILPQQWWSNQGCYSNTTCKIKHTHWMNANIISLPLGKQHDHLKLGYGVLIEIIAPSTLSNRKKSWTITRFISHK